MSKIFEVDDEIIVDLKKDYGIVVVEDEEVVINEQGNNNVGIIEVVI